jgi:hypothetical protein
MDMILTDTPGRRSIPTRLEGNASLISAIKLRVLRPTFLRHNGQLGVGRLTGPLTTIEGVDLRHVPKPTVYGNALPQLDVCPTRSRGAPAYYLS